MFKNLLLGGACALALILGAPARAGDARVQALLKQADAYRLADASMQVETEVVSYKSGQIDKTRNYTVLTQPPNKSLVLFRSPGESGQKVLMVGDDFWMLMPSSQRPIRITPMQKLLGDASVGDIATLSWANDYEGEIKSETTVDGTPCIVLDLKARRPGVSYAHVMLTVAKRDARPISAELFVASDKRAKTAKFETQTIEGRPIVTQMKLADDIQTGRETVVRYVARKPRSIPEEYFNPMFLTRNGVNL